MKRRTVLQFAALMLPPPGRARAQTPRRIRVGGLLDYGPNFLEPYRYAATFVGRVLKGAKPAELPVQQPTKFEFVVNLKTARAIGVTIPQSILLRADRVIG